jgi:hypothetical protein
MSYHWRAPVDSHCSVKKIGRKCMLNFVVQHSNFCIRIACILFAYQLIARIMYVAAYGVREQCLKLVAHMHAYIFCCLYTFCMSVCMKMYLNTMHLTYFRCSLTRHVLIMLQLAVRLCTRSLALKILLRLSEKLEYGSAASYYEAMRDCFANWRYRFETRTSDRWRGGLSSNSIYGRSQRDVESCYEGPHFV